MSACKHACTQIGCGVHLIIALDVVESDLTVTRLSGWPVAPAEDCVVACAGTSRRLCSCQRSAPWATSSPAMICRFVKLLHAWLWGSGPLCSLSWRLPADTEGQRHDSIFKSLVCVFPDRPMLPCSILMTQPQERLQSAFHAGHWQNVCVMGCHAEAHLMVRRVRHRCICGGLQYCVVLQAAQ